MFTNRKIFLSVKHLEELRRKTIGEKGHEEESGVAMEIPLDSRSGL